MMAHRLLDLRTAADHPADSPAFLASKHGGEHACAAKEASTECHPYLDSAVRDAALVQLPQRRRHLACRTQQRALRHVQRPAAVGVEGALYGARQRLEVALCWGRDEVTHNEVTHQQYQSAFVTRTFC